MAVPTICSVTHRISQVTQPRGGYIRPRGLTVKMLGDGIETLNPNENVSPVLMGITVDYMTRFMTGTPARDAFDISFLGAKMLEKHGIGLEHDPLAKAQTLIDRVKGLDSESLTAALQLSGFDTAYRAGLMTYRSVDTISPDAATLINLRTMVERGMHFFDIYGPKILDGLTFPGGYTNTVNRGDGDFLTYDTLWDFKVSKKRPTSKHTLQLLMYWRMGLHSTVVDYFAVRYLGIYNPRLNTVYRITTENIPIDVIDTVERKVIGYGPQDSLDWVKLIHKM